MLLKMAKENQENNRNAATVLSRDRYMDDLIHSCPTPKKAIDTIRELDMVLDTGSFKIKEWLSSSKDVLKALTHESVMESCQDTPSVKSDSDSPVDLDGEKGVKMLGVGWDPQADVLSFAVKETKILKYTKCSILSKISRLYDPLGLASAVTIKAKIALQNVLKSKEYDWDDPLPDDMNVLWEELFKEIQCLQGVTFPRCLQPENVSGMSQLYLFADASGHAYGAVAYLLWPTTEGPNVCLISAKARVAPSKQPTIPRLELMAALIASRLAKTIYDKLKIKPSSVTLWSDSKIVLHWLHSKSSTLKAFVGVRVTEIHSTREPSCWQFIPKDLNPADDLIQGIAAEDIHGRWETRPDFLKKPPEDWPKDPNPPVIEDPERKASRFLGLVSKVQTIVDSSNYSSWTQLTRVTAYILHFICNERGASKNPSTVGVDHSSQQKSSLQKRIGLKKLKAA